VIGEKRVLGLIVARGGSKGLPGKNLRLVGGRPLIVWTIQAAMASRCIDRLILSSDDREIIATAEKHGCPAPFVRPANLAEDHSTAEAVALHALDAVDEAFDYLVLLQPTSPFRKPEDIDGCLELCAARGAPGCVSVSPLDKPAEWIFRKDANSLLHPLLGGWDYPTQRQQAQPFHFLNGAVYVVDTAWFRAEGRFVSPDILAYEMPPERAVDIDTEWDLRWAEALLLELSEGTGGHA